MAKNDSIEMTKDEVLHCIELIEKLAEVLREAIKNSRSEKFRIGKIEPASRPISNQGRVALCAVDPKPPARRAKKA